MGSSLCIIPFNYFIKCIYDINNFLTNPYNVRNRVCSDMPPNYFNDSIFEPFFIHASPVPMIDELSIEELCFIHDMKEEDLNYELSFGSV